MDSEGEGQDSSGGDSRSDSSIELGGSSKTGKGSETRLVKTGAKELSLPSSSSAVKNGTWWGKGGTFHPDKDSFLRPSIQSKPKKETFFMIKLTFGVKVKDEIPGLVVSLGEITVTGAGARLVYSKRSSTTCGPVGNGSSNSGSLVKFPPDK